MEKSKLAFLGIIVLIVILQFISSLEEKVFLEDYELAFTYFGAEEDDEFSLTVTILNNANSEKKDVRFELDPSDPFDVKGDETWDIGTIGSEEEVKNTFRVEVDRDTTEGTYDLEFILEDSDDEFNEEVDIEVNSDKSDLIIGEVRTTPAILMADQDDIKLEIIIENLGGGDATFVRAKLNLPNGVSSSNSFSDTSNIGIIEAKGSKTATFFIDTSQNLNSGILKATLQLEFKDDVNSKTKVIDFDLPIKGGPLFRIIDSSTVPNNVEAGATGQLKVAIQNFGQEKGEETTVRVFENADQPIEFDEKTNFVGSLESGESATAIFTFTADSDAAANTYFVKTQIRTVSRGEVLVSEHTIPLTVSSSGGGNFSFLLILPIVLVIVLIILLAVRRRKQKTKK